MSLILVRYVWGRQCVSFFTPHSPWSQVVTRQHKVSREGQTALWAPHHWQQDVCAESHGKTISCFNQKGHGVSLSWRSMSSLTKWLHNLKSFKCPSAVVDSENWEFIVFLQKWVKVSPKTGTGKWATNWIMFDHCDCWTICAHKNTHKHTQSTYCRQPVVLLICH